MDRLRLYLAGGLFSAGERLHNLYLERQLRRLGYDVILPQREARRHFSELGFDLPAVVRSCQECAESAANILVGNVDGPDADSGTCIEYAIAISTTGRAVVYRTDFRTALDRELGLNGMLRLPGTAFVYRPCYFSEWEEIEPFYEALANEIAAKVQALSVREV